MRIVLFLTIISGTMIIETVLLLAGSAVAAVAIAIAAYVGVSKRHASSSIVAVSDISQSFSVNAEDSAVQTQSPEIKAGKSITQPEPSVSPSAASSVSVASAPIQEAPSPFPEESVSPTRTSAPTDVSALANISSPVDTTTQGILVIPTPKRRVRTKRLPTGASPPVPRKRRSPRNKPIVPETTTFTETAQSFGETPQGFNDEQSTGTAGQ